MATRLLFFGALKETAGGFDRLVELPADVTDARALIEWLAAGDLSLGEALGAPSVRIAIDQLIADRGQKFAAPREIAFMPPFSGG